MSSCPESRPSHEPGRISGPPAKAERAGRSLVLHALLGAPVAAWLAMLSSAAIARGETTTVSGEGSCPSPTAVASILKTLVPGAETAPVPHTHVRDDGSSYVVQVGEHTKRYVDRQRRCQDRARVAAAFAALHVEAAAAASAPSTGTTTGQPTPSATAGTGTSPAPALGDSATSPSSPTPRPPKASATETSSEGTEETSPTHSEQRAEPRLADVPSTEIRPNGPTRRWFAVGLHGAMSVTTEGVGPAFGAGIRAALGWDAWAASAGCSALSAASMNLPQGSVSLVRVPCHLDLAHQRTFGPVAAQLEVGALLGYLRVDGQSVPGASGGSRLEAGGHVALLVWPGRAETSYPYLLIDVLFNPRPYDLSVAPLGTQAHTPSVWTTFGLGYAVRP